MKFSFGGRFLIEICGAVAGGIRVPGNGDGFQLVNFGDRLTILCDRREI